MRQAADGGSSRLFSFGIGLSLVIGVCLLGIFAASQPLFLKVTATMGAGLAAGRCAAILTGLELNLHAAFICLLLFLVNLAWLCTLLPVFIRFLDGLASVRFLGGFLRATRDHAEINKAKVARWGPWALPVFVWLPFPFTGSFAAAVIGYLMGMPMKRLLPIVVISMFVGIVSWTYGFEYLLFLTGPTGKRITYAVVAVIVMHALLRRLRMTGQPPAEPPAIREPKGP